LQHQLLIGPQSMTRVEQIITHDHSPVRFARAIYVRRREMLIVLCESNLTRAQDDNGIGKSTVKHAGACGLAAKR
jgi:hypothetical protein